MKLNEVQRSMNLNAHYFQLGVHLMNEIYSFYDVTQKDFLSFIANQIDQNSLQHELAQKFKNRIFEEQFCSNLDKKLEHFLEYKFALKHYIENKGEQDEKMRLLFTLIEQMCHHLRKHSEYYRFNKNTSEVKGIINLLFSINKTLQDWYHLWIRYQECEELLKEINSANHTDTISNFIQLNYIVKDNKEQNNNISNFILFFNSIIEILESINKIAVKEIQAKIIFIKVYDEKIYCIVSIPQMIQKQFFQILNYFMVEGIAREILIKYIIKLLNEQEKAGLKNDKINNLSKKIQKQLSSIKTNLQFTFEHEENSTSTDRLSSLIADLQKNKMKIDDVLKSSPAPSATQKGVQNANSKAPSPEIQKSIPQVEVKDSRIEQNQRNQDIEKNSQNDNLNKGHIYELLKS